MPTHTKRIRSAIDDLPPGINFEIGRSFTSIAGADESELPDSQDRAASAPASQERGFKTPELPRAKKPKLQS